MTAGLAKKFSDIEAFSDDPSSLNRPYELLPFYFERLGEKYFVTNEVGEYLVLERGALLSLVGGRLTKGSELYRRLRSRHIIYDTDSDAALDLLALKVRTKHSNLRKFTSLHIFVVTLRCDYSCQYCQVSRQSADAAAYDMDTESAARALEFTFRSPNDSIKIEFQGGEPLLNFDLIRFIVEEAERINESRHKSLQFVITTNLTYVDEEILNFCDQHDILISTSLDGPREIHDANRPRPGKDGYQRTRAAIDYVRRRLGPERIGALMTTTERSLEKPREIVDEYLDAGFDSIFLRPISPYGFAIRTRQAEKYDFERWFEFYKFAMEYILELNRQGTRFVEVYTRLLLHKILSPYPTSYVDLQSPAGAGISVIVFNYDGGVYATDESRMLAEMGDSTFRLGSIKEDSYDDIMGNPVLLDMLEQSITVSTPMCNDCAYQAYCGSDPVYHHATQGDWVGHKAFSGFCKKTKSIVPYVIEKLEAGGADSKTLLNWLN